MKHLITIATILSVFFAPNAFAQKDDIRIDSGPKLSRWCKEESYNYLVENNIKPHSWTSSTLRHINDYETKGKWKVNFKVKKDKIRVICNVQIGKKTQYAKMLIFSESLVEE